MPYSYDDQNIFARILRGEIPNKTVTGDASIRWPSTTSDPQAPHHVLVIPKGRLRHLRPFRGRSLRPTEIGGFPPHGRQGLRDAGRCPGQDGAGYRDDLQRGRRQAMQEVPHYHLHILGGRNMGRLLPEQDEPASFGSRAGAMTGQVGPTQDRRCSMPIVFTPMPTAIARAHQAGCPDANGQTPERGVSDGSANPCRHCLGFVPAGAGMLILAYRPFPQPQPYAELGPIFLCADPLTCHAPAPSGVPPRMLACGRLHHPRLLSRQQDRLRDGRGGADAVDRAGGRGEIGRSTGSLCPRPFGPKQLLPVADRSGLGDGRASGLAGRRRTGAPGHSGQPRLWRPAPYPSRVSQALSQRFGAASRQVRLSRARAQSSSIRPARTRTRSCGR